MAPFTLTLTFLPLFGLAMAAIGILSGLKRRAILQEERARHDRQRFLGMGFLRKAGR